MIKSVFNPRKKVNFYAIATEIGYNACKAYPIKNYIDNFKDDENIISIDRNRALANMKTDMFGVVGNVIFENDFSNYNFDKVNRNRDFNNSSVHNEIAVNYKYEFFEGIINDKIKYIVFANSISIHFANTKNVLAIEMDNLLIIYLHRTNNFKLPVFFTVGNINYEVIKKRNVLEGYIIDGITKTRLFFKKANQ